MKSKFISYYMGIAQLTAQLSTANKLKVGAIAVKNGRIISEGYNGTTAGSSNQCEDENGMTFPYVIHAEGNLIAKLAKCTESSEGAVIFLTHSPCLQCSKLIQGAGISTIYYKTDYRSDEGINFLKENNIEVIKVNDYE
jgi:dCMP deaminase